MARSGSAPKKLEYEIGGMDCASCATTIQTAIDRMPGVSELRISVARERMQLLLDEKQTGQEKIVKAVKSLGFSATLIGEGAANQNHDHAAHEGCKAHDHSGHDHAAHDHSGHDHDHDHGTCGGDHAHGSHEAEPVAKAGQTVMKVGGMDCASCAGTITTALQGMPGVSDVQVSVAREQMTLTLAPGMTSIGQIQDAVRKLGFTAEMPSAAAAAADAGLPSEPEEAQRKKAWWQAPKAKQLGIAAAAIGGAYLATFLQPDIEYWAFTLATVIAVWPIARKAFVAARYGAFFTIQMLMTIAAIGAVIIGEQEEAAVVILLFTLGEMLEGLAADRARSGIRALGKLLPRDALVEGQDGSTTRVAADSLRIGQIVIARPGDRIAADGEILTGISSVDESPVTGESVPVSKQPGERVRAGTVNHDATLRIQVDRAPEDNTIARIIAMVEEAQDAKAPTERYIDRLSRVYMPIILTIAAMVAVVPPLMGWGDWQTWIYRALALILIGCPCALVISVPAAVASSLSAGARAGMLIKGGAVLEMLASTKYVAFDKTGTLTLGKPKVTDAVAVNGELPRMLALSAAIERESSHPLATAIVAHASETGADSLAASDVRIVPGKGMEGKVQGQSVFIGAPKHAAERAPLPEDAAKHIAALEEQGKTVAVVVVAGNTMGLIAMRDEPRSESKAAIAALKAQSVTPLMMTGDNPRTGGAIGRQLGIDVKAGMLPEDKSRAVAEIAAKQTIVMVGDGVNDAPALAAAQVGVAIGSGTDVAMEAADAALMRDRVDDIPRMIALSRATMRNIRQNVGISLGLKAIFLVTTVTGVTGLWLAVFADTGATVLVTANAMRLLGFFRGKSRAA